MLLCFPPDQGKSVQSVNVDPLFGSTSALCLHLLLRNFGLISLTQSLTSWFLSAVVCRLASFGLHNTMLTFLVDSCALLHFIVLAGFNVTRWTVSISNLEFWHLKLLDCFGPHCSSFNADNLFDELLPRIFNGCLRLSPITILAYWYFGNLSSTMRDGSLAFIFEFVVDISGHVGRAIFIENAVFLIGILATCIRFFPSIQKNFDYGVVIFLLTFNLITVSSYGVPNVLNIVHQRLVTIGIGCANCLLVFLSGLDMTSITLLSPSLRALLGQFKDVSMTMIKAQAGVKNNMKSLIKSIVQSSSSHILQVVLFALLYLFQVVLWSKFSRR